MRHAVILAGGSGSRLWPASRRKLPKQFLHLGGDDSLLVATARRLPATARLAVVAGADQRPEILHHLPELPAERFIAEPIGRNTAAAMGLAAIHLLATDPDAVMGALPADHHVADEAGFAALVERAFAAAEADDLIVTIGLVPTRPETGFGYLELGAPLGDDSYQVARFVEKPDRATAEAYIAGGNHLWNGGMFFLRARRLIDELARHMPETHRGLTEIADALAGGIDPTAVAERVFPKLPATSIDYGVMERTTGVVTLRGDFGWHDVGSWSALADYRDSDAAGNVVVGDAMLREARRNILVSDPDHLIAVIGVEDLVVVQAGNAVLVVPRHRAQEVRDLVANLEASELDRFL